MTPQELAFMRSYADGAPRDQLQAQLASMQEDQTPLAFNDAMQSPANSPMPPPAPPPMAPPQTAPQPIDAQGLQMQRYLAGPTAGPSAASALTPRGTLSGADLQAINEAAANADMRRQLMTQQPIEHAAPTAPSPALAAAIAPPAAAAQPSAPAPPAGPHPHPGPSKPATAAPGADLAGALAQYGGPEDADLAAAGGSSELQSAQALGATPVGETRELAPVKLGALDRSELDEQRDKQYAGESELLQTTEDARRQQRWAQKVTDQKVQDLQKGDLAKQDARAASFRDLLAKHDQQAEQIKEIGIEEPSLWTGNVGSDILRGIGLMLMGIGGHPEMAVARINKIMDDNLALQKERIGKKREDFKQSGLLLDRMGQVYDDEAHRDAAAKEVALSGLEASLKRFTEFAADPVERARGEQGLAAVREQRVAAEAAVNEHFADKVTQQSRYIPKGAGAVDPLKAAQYDLAYRKAKGWDPALWVPLAHGYASNEIQHGKILEAGVATRNVVGTLAKIRQLAADVASAKIPGAKAHAQANTLVEDLQLQFKEAKKLGAISGDDASRLTALAPKISILEPNAVTAYETMISQTNIAYHNEQVARGMRNGPPPPDFRDETTRPAGVEPERPPGG